MSDQSIAVPRGSVDAGIRGAALKIREEPPKRFEYRQKAALVHRITVDVLVAEFTRLKKHATRPGLSS